MFTKSILGAAILIATAAFYAEDQAARTARLVIDTDADAEVWIGSQRLTDRTLTTPPLQPGNYRYEIKVRWVRCDGKACRIFERKIVTPLFGPGADLRIPARLDVGPPTAPGAKPGATSMIEGANVEKDGSTNYGIQVEQICQPSCPGPEAMTINGIKVDRRKGIEALAGDGALPDDRKLLRLTVAGPKEFQRQVLADLERDPLKGFSDRILVQAYTPDAWELKESGFAPGNQVYLQAPDGKVLYRAENYAGGPEKLSRALRRAAPDYQPARDPGPNGNTQDAVLAIALCVAAVKAMKP